MSTISFDTGAGIRHLREHGFTQEQAEAIVQTLREAQAELATKSDLRLAIAELKIWTGKVMVAGVGFLTVIIGLSTVANHFWK